jgi:hypothetical protein
MQTKKRTAVRIDSPHSVAGDQPRLLAENWLVRESIRSQAMTSQL